MSDTSGDPIAASRYHQPLIVEALLASPLAGEAPQLDALLEFAMHRHMGSIAPGWEWRQASRSRPAPQEGLIPVPLRREWVAGRFVASASSPILALASSSSEAEGSDYINKRIESRWSPLLAANERRMIETGSGWTKSYRLPLRTRTVPSVRWLAIGDRREMLKKLRHVRAIGSKTAVGYGRVAEWRATEDEAGLSCLFAESPQGPVLMRPLPVCDRLPRRLLGARATYGACSPPYWHPDRFGEIVVPC